MAAKQARYEPLVAQAREWLRDTRIWNISSTAVGGGVAEMLAGLVAYGCGVGIDVRWSVIEGDPAFFRTTKRLHNALHGEDRPDGPVSGADRRHYEEVLAAQYAALRERIQPGDVVIIHDPQPAGLAPMLRQITPAVVWRCHVGREQENSATRWAWEFLRPYVGELPALVFSLAAYAPSWVPPEQLTVIPPSIDPFSAKNQDLRPEQVRAVLAAAGLIALEGAPPARFTRTDGREDLVRRAAEVVGEGPPPGPDVQLVVQVSRWDRLKDPAGVLRGFAEHVVGSPEADRSHLMCVGPDVSGVTDDPEGQQVLAECRARWGGLAEEQRRRISLVSLPMADLEENATCVNALQRHAAIVVQKSLAEGFGLTVAEAMWKKRPIVASRVGGIGAQIDSGVQGLLLDDPTDLAAYGAAVRALLRDPARADAMGLAAARRVDEEFLPDRHLAQWVALAGALLRGGR